jgi:hypothetical protein
MKRKKLGCCGYDDLGYKPPTTTPYDPTRAIKVANQLAPGLVSPTFSFGSGQPLKIANRRGR